MYNLFCDYKNNYGFTSRYVMIVYRYGNYVFYRVKLPLIRQILLILYVVFNNIAKLISGSTIPARCKIGKGLRLEHNGNGVVIYTKAVIGNNVRIFQQVTIGANDPYEEQVKYGAPLIGDNVFIGAGAKIIGPIKIGEGAKIGANAVVNTDIPNGATAVGIPASIKKLVN